MLYLHMHVEFLGSFPDYTIILPDSSPFPPPPHPPPYIPSALQKGGGHYGVLEDDTVNLISFIK